MATLEATSGRFSVMIASDLDDEKVSAEIYLDEKFVALVNQEERLDRKRLEFPGSGFVEEQLCRDVDLDGFLLALQAAARKLEGE